MSERESGFRHSFCLFHFYHVHLLTAVCVCRNLLVCSLSFALSSAGLLCTGHLLVSFPRLVVVFVLVFFLFNIFVSARLLWFPAPLQHYYWSWTLLYRCSLDCYWYWSLDSPGLPFASLG